MHRGLAQSAASDRPAVVAAAPTKPVAMHGVAAQLVQRTPFVGAAEGRSVRQLVTVSPELIFAHLTYAKLTENVRRYSAQVTTLLCARSAGMRYDAGPPIGSLPSLRMFSSCAIEHR